MGTYEDDRIRAKNKVQQAAYDMHLELSNEGLSDDAIAGLCKGLMDANPADARNEIYSTVLKIVGRSDDYEEVTTCRNCSCKSDSE